MRPPKRLVAPISAHDWEKAREHAEERARVRRYAFGDKRQDGLGFKFPDPLTGEMVEKPESSIVIGIAGEIAGAWWWGGGIEDVDLSIYKRGGDGGFDLWFGETRCEVKTRTWGQRDRSYNRSLIEVRHVDPKPPGLPVLFCELRWLSAIQKEMDGLAVEVDLCGWLPIEEIQRRGRKEPSKKKDGKENYGVEDRDMRDLDWLRWYCGGTFSRNYRKDCLR